MEFELNTLFDMLKVLAKWQILPLYKNDIKGYSLEEHISPDVWHSDSPVPWEWIGESVKEVGCAFGWFFENTPAFVSNMYFPNFANFRRSRTSIPEFFQNDPQLKEQYLCHTIITDFVHRDGQSGISYGWGREIYSTPEESMFKFPHAFVEDTPEKSFQLIVSHLCETVPGADEASVKAFLL